MGRLTDAWDALTHRRDTALSSIEREGIDLIAADLALARAQAGPYEPRGSLQTWRETLFVSTADTTVSNTTTESVMAPNFLLPANYLYAGRALKWTILGDVSTVVTTPGTQTFRLRAGTSTTPASNASVCASAAVTPDTSAGSTNVVQTMELWCVQRTTGITGTMWGLGHIFWNDLPSITAALVNQQNIPVSAPAAATVDSTVANYVMPTVTFSVSTNPTNSNTRIALFEALT